MKENSNIILTFLDEGISRIKINDTSNYNALSSKNISSLIDIFKSLNSDNKTKVIIIEGAGKGFSAGHDLKEIRSLKKRVKYKKLFNSCSKLTLGQQFTLLASSPSKSSCSVALIFGSVSPFLYN